MARFASWKCLTHERSCVRGPRNARDIFPLGGPAWCLPSLIEKVLLFRRSRTQRRALWTGNLSARGTPDRVYKPARILVTQPYRCLPPPARKSGRPGHQRDSGRSYRELQPRLSGVVASTLRVGVDRASLLVLRRRQMSSPLIHWPQWLVQI